MLLLDGSKVKPLLNWDETFTATESALKAVSQRRASISERVFSTLFQSQSWMVTMSGGLDDTKYGAWACKILTGNPQNVKSGLPSSSGNILLFDETSGIPKAIIDGRDITNYRTAAASAVATKHLYISNGKPLKILAIFGAGEQGQAHAESFNHYFGFEQIRIWNRTLERATVLANKLNDQFITTKFKAFSSAEQCAKDADILITATTPGSVPILRYEWVKSGAHINAIGVSAGEGLELDDPIYKHAKVYVDSREVAERELKKLKRLGVDLGIEVGQVALGEAPPPAVNHLTVFQSLGLIVEDCAMVRMLFDKYMKQPVS
ncbi:ketimine reductase mu-crystallin [Rhynchophorus ferrugineus]|uniref:ketimine reductase mu-crystallin n=1 Tax=Rhynchophorus ferrugineus TaxID=354439 RepID=UPI003FCE07E4